ncbi:MAG: RNA polymerase sigma factor RpoH [Rickettsiales bacterium]
MNKKKDTRDKSLPVLSADLTFSNYVNEVKKYPTLTAEEEYMLAKRVLEYHDADAAHKLVTSHLKLVAKMAYKMRGYGVALMDLVSEGNIGLMHAVKKFDPDLGHRFSTYAMWWIKAAMQEFVIKSWSLVKIGTTAAQKKLFFNLNKAKKRMNSLSNVNHDQLDDASAVELAKELNVSQKELKDMNGRLAGGDISLDQNLNKDGESGVAAIDLIPESRINQEASFIASENQEKQKRLFSEAFQTLDEREKKIISSRHLGEEIKTLSDLSKEYDISTERVRQIESRAIEKIKKYCLLNN